jgi:hypothetical protein
MNQLSVNKAGLVLGGVLAIWHAVWSLMVAVGLAKPFLDWVLKLHFLNFQYSISPFSLAKAVLLVIVTGIFGYLFGLVVAWLWNLLHRAAHS